jgi:tetratricopeptide (TPR) repeat protein
MKEDLLQQIRNNFELFETDDLLEIWKTHNSDEWTEEAFIVLKEILFKRLGTNPEVSIRPQLSQVFEQIAALRKIKSFIMALDECEQAVKLAPDNPEVQYYLGLVNEDLGQPEQALDCYQKAVRLDPDYEAALKKLKILEKVIEKQYKMSAAKRCLERAIVKAEDEEMESALREIELAKNDLPKIAAAYNDYGLALLTAMKFDEAIEAFLEAIRLNPHYSGVHTNLRNARVLQEEARNISYADDQSVYPSGEEDLSEDFDEASFEKNPDEVMDTPGYMYLDKQAGIVTGASGYRTRPGRSGYDPLDMRFEEARMEGSLLRRLFTGNLRTHDPLYLIMMTILGVIFSLPLIFVLGMSNYESPGAMLMICPFGLIGISGVSLLINVVVSVLSKKPKEIEDKGGVFF